MIELYLNLKNKAKLFSSITNTVVQSIVVDKASRHSLLKVLQIELLDRHKLRPQVQ